MFKPGAKDDLAALALDDLASAIDAGLPIESIGGNPDLGEHVLLDLAWQRGIKLRPTERIVLEAGWKSGNGAAALRGRAASRRRRAEFQREVWGALSYPMTLLAMMPLAAVATYSIVGPSFAIGLGVAYALIALLVFAIARKLGRGDASLERNRILGPLLEDLRELPYLESLHALYGAGMPIVQAHATAVRGVRMHGLRERLGATQLLLEQGTELREALQQSGALSLETRQLLATGEQAGQLEDALQRALTRRQEVATRKLSLAAKRLGQITYTLAVIGVIVLVYQFYGSYAKMLSGIR
jgi:type II secretory pathway component PulF